MSKEKLHPFVNEMKKIIQDFFDYPDLFSSEEIADMGELKELDHVMAKYSGFITYTEDGKSYWLFIRNDEDMMKKVVDLKTNKNVMVTRLERIR